VGLETRTSHGTTSRGDSAHRGRGLCSHGATINPSRVSNAAGGNFSNLSTEGSPSRHDVGSQITIIWETVRDNVPEQNREVALGDMMDIYPEVGIRGHRRGV
jgi:hypothetical protein